MNDTTFVEKYRKIHNEYTAAKDLLCQGYAKYSLNATRNALEGTVNAICNIIGIDSFIDNDNGDNRKPLFDKIEELNKRGYLSDEEKSIFHKARVLGNKGSHSGEIDEDEPTIEEAESGYDYITKVLEIFRSKEDENFLNMLKEKNNVPEKNPSYYSSKVRNYFGKWYYSYSREDLQSDGEYTELKRKADDGDISAMLDIASGFLPKKNGIFWNDRNLICMPKYYYNGEEYFNINAYDTRYYYWVLKACTTAVEKEKKSEYYPKKYIANALLDAIKFILYTRTEQLNSYISKVYSKKHDIGIAKIPEIKKNISNQYQEVFEIYGEDVQTIGNVYDFEVLLLQLIEQYGTDIITIHQENTSDRIKYLVYCYAAICGERNLELNYVPSELIDESDKQHKITVEILQKYINDDINRIHYAFTYNQIQIINQQNQRRIEQQAADSSNSSAPGKLLNKKAIIIIAVALFVIFVLPLASKLIFSAISNAPKQQPKLSVTEITDNSIDFKFKKEEERKRYSFITEKEGKYRFNFETDDVNCTYFVALYDSENIEIFNTMCSKDIRGQSCKLRANEEYTIVVTQYVGYPEGRITIHEPTDEIQVENYEINGSFEYAEQENIYSFKTNEEGIYGFDFKTDNAKTSYNVALYSSINEELFSESSNNDENGMVIKLKADEAYKLVVTQKEGYPNYKIIIHKPQPPVTIDGSFSGEVTYKSQENIYYFTPVESGMYQFVLNSGNDTTADCEIELYDNTNNNLSSFTYNNFTYEVDLEQGKQYKFVVRSLNEKAKFNVTIEKVTE